MGRILVVGLARAFVAACVGAAVLPLVSALFEAFGAARAFQLAICVSAFAIYSAVYYEVRSSELRKARTALFVMEKTCNFGHKGGDRAWEDWVGVTRRGPNQDRPLDVYRAPLPKMHRPGRRR